MFWNRKHRVQADELAGSLFDEFVQRPIEWDMDLQIDTSITSAIGQKVRLYQFASVMLAVLDAERSNAAFSPVRDGLEQRFFQPTFSDGLEQLDEVKRAMEDLSELIQPDGQSRPMSWAMRWLNDAGIQQENPANLMMFVLRWPSFFATVVKALRVFEPVT